MAEAGVQDLAETATQDLLGAREQDLAEAVTKDLLEVSAGPGRRQGGVPGGVEYACTGGGRDAAQVHVGGWDLAEARAQGPGRDGNAEPGRVADAGPGGGGDPGPSGSGG